MENSGRDSLSAAPWLDDDAQLHALPLIEEDDDAFASSLAHAPLLDHDDVNALFPLLGDSSLECEADQALTGDPEQPPFDSDLSPIFAAKTAPLARHRPATTGGSGITLLTPRSKRSLDLSSSKGAAASRSARKALGPVNQEATAGSPDARGAKRHSFTTPVRRGEQEAQTSSSSGGSVPKRKRTSATEPALVSSVWSEQEQSLFFSTFKTKWPVDSRSADATKQAPSFSSMLLQRFDAISKRIKTKSVMEVRQFYTNVLGNIAVLLREVEHDVNLTNPDQVRIAVWCWSKLLTDDSHRNDFLAIGSADPPTKLRIAHVLLQTIIRSRRQMLKAKSSAGGVYNGVSSSSAALKAQEATPVAPATPAKSPEGPSAVAVALRATPVVHHPTVRRKLTPKRKRTESDPRSEDANPAVVDETPLKFRRQRTEVAFASPALPQLQATRQRELQQQQITSQTPPRSSKKKMYIKMRIVPMDDTSKAHVARTGCNPKVELKLTATKKISEVAQHMAAKWIQVRAFVPADALLQFHEHQQQQEEEKVDKSDSTTSRGECWSERDRTVTCFDIWKRCGKQVKSENVVVVYYSWQRPKTKTVEILNGSREVDTVARSPGSLFAEEISLADVSTAAAAAGSTSSSTRGLQQFGENLAFQSGEFFDAAGGSRASEKPQQPATCPLAALLDENDDDDAATVVDCSPNTQRLRRRITPVLVSTEEFDL